MNTIRRSTAITTAAVALTLPLLTASPALASTPTTLTISTTKAKLEGGTAYRVDENGGKKLIAGAHFRVDGFLTCHVDLRSTQAFISAYVGEYAAPGGWGGGWFPCNSSFSFDVPGAKGATTLHAYAASRYGGATVEQPVHLIGSGVDPASKTSA